MFLLIFLIWLIFVGTVTLESCVIGAAVSAVLFLFVCKFAGHSIHKEKLLIRMAPTLIKFAGLVLVEIFKANLATAHFILTQKEEIEPVLVTFKKGYRSALSKAMLADSITITPGTITAMVNDDTFVVHALDESFADGIDESGVAQLIDSFDEEAAH